MVRRVGGIIHQSVPSTAQTVRRSSAQVERSPISNVSQFRWKGGDTASPTSVFKGVFVSKLDDRKEEISPRRLKPVLLCNPVQDDDGATNTAFRIPGRLDPDLKFGAKPSEIRAAAKGSREKMRAEIALQNERRKQQEAVARRMQKIKDEIDEIKRKECTVEDDSSKTSVMRQRYSFADTRSLVLSLEGSGLVRSPPSPSKRNTSSSTPESAGVKRRGSYGPGRKSSVLTKKRSNTEEDHTPDTMCDLPQDEVRLAQGESLASSSADDIDLGCSAENEVPLDELQDSLQLQTTTPVFPESPKEDEACHVVLPPAPPLLSPSPSLPQIQKTKNQLQAEVSQKTSADLMELNRAQKQFDEGHDLCWKQCMPNAALDEYREALYTRERILGKYHEATGRTYYWMGKSYVKLKQYDQALMVYARAYRIFQRVLKKSSKYNIWADAAIEALFREMSETGVIFAEEYKMNLLESIDLEQIGDQQRKKGMMDEAVAAYRRAIDLLEDCHPDAADLRCNVATLLRQQQEYELALEEYAQAAQIYEQSLGSQHPGTIKTSNQLVEKKKLIQKALTIQEKLESTPY